MIRASFYGTAFLSGVAVGAGIVGGVVGIAKIAAACREEMSPAPVEPVVPVESLEPVSPKKPRASKRAKSEAHASRKPSEPDPHRAKSWKN